MPKKDITSINKARQALLKLGRESLKRSRQKAAAQRDAELVAKWRALSKTGLLKTTATPAKSRLTRSRIASINSAFNKLQRAGHYENGKVNHPLQRQEYKTPSGKSRVKYTFSDNFKFLKSTKKVKETRGVIKTKKGYIIEKSKDSKVWIDKHGELKTKSHGIIWTSRTYNGEEILDLYRAIKEGDIKLTERNFLAWNPWGGSASRSVTDNDLFIKLIDEYVTQMSASTWNGYIDKTTFHFGKWEK